LRTKTNLRKLAQQHVPIYETLLRIDIEVDLKGRYVSEEQQHSSHPKATPTLQALGNQARDIPGYTDQARTGTQSAFLQMGIKTALLKSSPFTVFARAKHLIQ
jgi:hypothetical protein